MLTIDLIREAATRIAGRVHRTPVVTSRSFNEVAGCEVFFKCENLQRGGSFKARGATNKILSLNDDERERGVIAVSSGNHAQAVALAARAAGTRAVICLPEDAQKMKVAATRGYGADIRFFNRHKDDRDVFGREIAERENVVMVPGYDDYLTMAGQGTCGLEFLEEIPDLDSIMTACSGGGLFAGVSSAAKAIKGDVFFSLPPYREARWLRTVLLNPHCDEQFVDRVFENVDSFAEQTRLEAKGTEP